MKIFFISTLLLILISWIVSAEDLSKALQENTYSPLELRGYELDIETATESSLLAWVQRLGLSETGASPEQLQEALYEYYGLEVPEIRIGINKTDSVTIVSADNLSLINTYGSIVILSGNVVVEITETLTDNLYTIHAQQIVLNNSIHNITAAGSVLFIKSNRETREELNSFICSKFSLSINSWEGIISNLDISSSRENSKGEDVSLSLAGDSVYKSSKGILIIENGIVSSDNKDPHFSIQAETISILNDGDWFAEQAFLYVGRVPVFYLPFFFYPGVEFFFNPSFGFSLDRGAFFNTTTMIFGTLNEPETTAASLTTFLQADTQTKRSISGLQGTLFNMYLPESEIVKWAKETESYFAVNFDVYERVGAALGIDASLNEFLFLQNLSVKSIISVNPDPDSPLFRFLIEPDMNIDTSGFSFTISLPFYSDELVSKDYMQRKTQFELGDLTNIAQFPSKSNIDNFIWNIKGSIKPDIAFLKPIVEQLVISNISSQVEWDIIQPYIYEISSVGLLAHSAKISGQLLTGSISKDNETQASNNSTYSGINSYEPSLTGFTGNLFDFTLDTEITAKSTDNVLHLPFMSSPNFLPDAVIPVVISEKKIIDEYFQYRISYTIENSGNVDIIFNEGEPQYQKIINRFDSNLIFSGNFIENFISIRNVLKPSGYIQQHNKLSDSILNWSSYIDQDRARTKFVLNDELTAKIPEFGLSYMLKTRLLTYNFVDTDFLVSTFSWNEENVLQHSISASIPISILSSVLSVSMTLPPKNSGINPKFETKAGNITASLETTLAEDNSGIWQYDPLKFRASYFSAKNPLSGSIFAGYDLSKLSTAQNIFIPLTIQSNLSYNFTETIRLSQKLFFDFGGNILEQGISRVDIGETFAELLFLFDETAAEESRKIIPAKIKIHTDNTLSKFAFWKNRIILSTDFISNWNYNFQNPSDNLLSVSFAFTIKIEEFLDISIVSKSRNSATHRYMNVSDFLDDLFKSFNFFNINDRYDSNFNLSEIEMHIIHYMKDWNLNFDYSGKVALNSDNEYVWSPLASIYIAWKAVPEIDISASIEHDTITGIQ